MEIDMDEFGRFWVFNEDGDPISGPYDTPEQADENYPEAEHVY